MRIAVLGAGAVGSVYGALLARAGHEVTLIDIAAEHVDAIRRVGLAIAGEDTPVPVAASTDPADARDAEAVLVLVKSNATSAAAHSLAPHLAPDAIAVTLQNGLGNDRALAAVLGSERVVAGATTVGAELLGPGLVAASPSALAGDSLTSLGAPAEGTGACAAAERLADALSGSGLPAELRDDVELVIWRKLAFTASMAPLCALLRCNVAEALASEPGRRALRLMFDEVVAVGAASGVALDGGELWAQALATWEGIGPHRPSLAVDLEAGRATEIDALSGALAALGAKHGVATPAAELAAALVGAAQSSPVSA
jgi:2-dehydropantoate 2-reductase